MKEANLIIIGGTIAAGKSTLVEGIAREKGFYPVPELREGDIVQDIILQKLYEGKRIHAATIQFYFVMNRLKQYKDSSEGNITSILDRGIWEDWFFAELLMSSSPEEYNHFKVFWKKTIEEKISTYGLPKAYIYTKVDWNTFRGRIFGRNREAEIRNFANNEQYFKNLLSKYTNDFENLLKNWGIYPIVIDTVGKNPDEVLEIALLELKKKGL